MSTLAALTFPAIVLLLVVISVVEALWVWFTGLGLVPWLRKRTGRSITTATLTDLNQVFEPGKQTEIEHLTTQESRKDDVGDAAPPAPEDASAVPDSPADGKISGPPRTMSAVDLDRGVVVYFPPPRND